MEFGIFNSLYCPRQAYEGVDDPQALTSILIESHPPRGSGRRSIPFGRQADKQQRFDGIHWHDCGVFGFPTGNQDGTLFITVGYPAVRAPDLCCVATDDVKGSADS